MGLKISKQLISGHTVEYWHISTFILNKLTKQTEIILMPFENYEFKESGGSPDETGAVSFSFSGSDRPETIDECYSKIKTLSASEFTGNINWSQAVDQ